MFSRYLESWLYTYYSHWWTRAKLSSDLPTIQGPSKNTKKQNLFDEFFHVFLLTVIRIKVCRYMFFVFYVFTFFMLFVFGCCWLVNFLRIFSCFSCASWFSTSDHNFFFLSLLKFLSFCSKIVGFGTLLKG